MVGAGRREKAQSVHAQEVLSPVTFIYAYPMLPGVVSAGLSSSAKTTTPRSPPRRSATLGNRPGPLVIFGSPPASLAFSYLLMADPPRQLHAGEQQQLSARRLDGADPPRGGGGGGGGT